MGYAQALTHFLSCPMSLFPDGDHIDMAIKVVGEAKDEALAEQLTDYLMGGTDSTPKVYVRSFAAAICKHK